MESSKAYWLANLHPDPAAPGLISSIPKIVFRGKIAVVVEVYHQRWLEEGGEWLENVDPTYLVLVSGQLVLQKIQVV